MLETEKWKDNITNIDSFTLPIKIDYDNEYDGELKAKLKEYIEKLQEIGVPEKTISNVKKANHKIESAIKDFYNGEVANAQKKIYALIKRYIDNPVICTNLDNSCAFRDLDAFTKNANSDIKIALAKELTFFKGRVGEPSDKFELKDMLHIPFDKRSKVTTQRFNISGLPCMYFGVTSYVCWLELGKPATETFNVASYHLHKDIKVLNLAISLDSIYNVKDRKDLTFDVDEFLNILIEIWPLICATSFKINEKNRQFKSEYTVSQLIMMSLRELEIDAVAYISKQADNDNDNSNSNGVYTYPVCVNIAIPVKHDGSNLSEIAKKIESTQAVNFREYCFRDSVGQGAKLSYVNSVFSSVRIILAGKDEFYSTSEFGRFDNYLTSLEYNALNDDSTTF